MLTDPVELTIGQEGQLQLPLSLLAQSGLNPGDSVLAFVQQDGVIALRRFEDAAEAVLQGLPPG